MPSASRRTDCRKLWITSGLKTFSSKLPLAPPTLMATSLPMTCAASIVTASHWVGLTLPGMMELPGSFSGMLISPSPERGPLASQRTSLAIFIRPAASVFKAPCANSSASCEASAWNLLGADTNALPVSWASSADTLALNCGCAFRPVPTAVPPMASWCRPASVARICCSARSSCAT
ncbi:Uncharacterised protein [Bordetella pertussis]|nr:Uncharacterised protein [Bordetella pertussis]